MVARSGGQYTRAKDGKLKQTEKPTASHKDGDAPRGKDGTRLDRPMPVTLVATTAAATPDEKDAE